MKHKGRIIKIIISVFTGICVLLIAIIAGITIYISSSTNHYYHDAGQVACSMVSDTYGIHVKDHMTCTREDDNDGNLYAIRVMNENMNYLYFTKNTSYENILTSKHHKKDCIKTETIPYHQHDLKIQYFAYDGTKSADNGETLALLSIYAVFDYLIDDVHVYSSYIGVSTDLPGKVEDMKEGSYEHTLQKQITDILDNVMD